jgi:hypothetical protein
MSRQFTVAKEADWISRQPRADHGCIMGTLDFLEECLRLNDPKNPLVNSQECTVYHPYGDRKQAKATKEILYTKPSSHWI